MNNYIVAAIVLLVVGFIALLIGIIYKGYSSTLEESENWKRVVFWFGVVFLGFSLILFIVGAFKSKKTTSTYSYEYSY